MGSLLEEETSEALPQGCLALWRSGIAQQCFCFSQKSAIVVGELLLTMHARDEFLKQRSDL
jgi:hypothetical protein